MNIPDIIRRELDRAPGRWEITEGTRHLKIKVDGMFIAILPKRGGDDRSRRGQLNVRAQIRRAINAPKEGKGC